jgi:hypothetical protein
MENYRGYIIELDFIYHDPFTKIPNGLVDGMWYKDEEEDGQSAHGIYRQTIQEVKREIDDLLFEKTEYRVIREIPKAGKTITKFLFLSDHNGEMGALSFASKVGGEILLFIDGQEAELSFNF